MRDLKRGDRAAEVHELRRKLHRWAREEECASGLVDSYRPPWPQLATFSDSMFDLSVEAAVKIFQDRNGLKVDGRAGPIVQLKLGMVTKEDLEAELAAMDLEQNTTCITGHRIEAGSWRYQEGMAVGFCEKCGDMIQAGHVFGGDSSIAILQLVQETMLKMKALRVHNGEGPEMIHKLNRAVKQARADIESLESVIDVADNAAQAVITWMGSGEIDADGDVDASRSSVDGQQ